MGSVKDGRATASLGEMLGVYLREASVLVLVFGVLDHPAERLPAVLVVSMSLLAAGLGLERIRK